MKDFSMPATVDWSAYAARYDMLLHYNPAYIDLLERFERWIDIHAPEGPFRAVDIGAGTGSFAERLLERRGDAFATLVEPAPAMRAYASAKLERFGERAKVIDGDFTTPHSDSYDAVRPCVRGKRP